MTRFIVVSTAVLVVLASCWVSVASGQTIDEIGYTEERCAAIREDPTGLGYVPCECRLNTGNVEASRCYPYCCPKTTDFEGDRCHLENKLSWNVYEQLLCREQPLAEYLADNPNCYYRGNPPLIKTSTWTGATHKLGFELSILDDHVCHNLYVAKCKTERAAYPQNDFRLNTTDETPKHCWLTCPPDPVAECTASSCVYHRGETRSVIQDWTIPAKLLPGDYALVCYTLTVGEAVDSTLYQNAYASSSFKVDG